jgi:hypothetical protein
MKFIRFILRLLFLAYGYVPRLTFSDTIKAQGTVKIYFRLPDGSRQLAYVKNNLVVNVGRTLLTQLLGGGAGTAVTKIAFGSSGTAAIVTNTTLGTELLEKAATVSYPAYNTVMFAASMLSAEGNGNTYREIGLKNAANTLFSRLVISDVVKSSAYEIDVEWTIAFI